MGWGGNVIKVMKNISYVNMHMLSGIAKMS